VYLRTCKTPTRLYFYFVILISGMILVRFFSLSTISFGSLFRSVCYLSSNFLLFYALHFLVVILWIRILFQYFVWDKAFNTLKNCVLEILPHIFYAATVTFPYLIYPRGNYVALQHLFCCTQVLIAFPEPQSYFPSIPFVVTPRNYH
jgi:hypothetical protein